jgi:hypothetical protein
MINENAFFSILTFHNDIYSFINVLFNNVSIFTWSLPKQHMFICQWHLTCWNNLDIIEFQPKNIILIWCSPDLDPVSTKFWTSSLHTSKTDPEPAGKCASYPELANTGPNSVSSYWERILHPKHSVMAIKLLAVEML